MSAKVLLQTARGINDMTHRMIEAATRRFEPTEKKEIRLPGNKLRFRRIYVETLIGGSI